ncbi:hypothetical protein AeRB84_003195 [Aphanomyces euteiches]|nr:hypothetical protein AeRB84_003195 [Aphanomyces euteiches]
MSRHTFTLLLQQLQQHGLQSSPNIRATEKLTIAIYIFTGEPNRNTQERFQHSGETMSRVFGKVCTVIGKLQPSYISQYSASDTPIQIRRNPKWYPFFSNCIGALDGTHIPASVSSSIRSRFRDRGGDVSQNVFAACTFDLPFSFILAGWEGSAHDGRVLQDAYTKGFAKQQGRYYLGDAGYALSPRVLTPYRGVRYHLKVFQKGNKKPVTMQKLFNLRHASCRNVIERTFGVV